MSNKNFVAVNYIDCKPEYKERFEKLFGSRAKQIDTMPGFIDMRVLRPSKDGDAYLIVSHWENEESFKNGRNQKHFWMATNEDLLTLLKRKLKERKHL